MLKATTDGATADAPPVNNVMPSFGASKRSALKSGVREAFGGNSSNTEENEDIPRFSKRQFLRNMMLRSQKAKEKEKEKDNNGERQHRRQASTATRTATTDAAGRSEAKANATKVISTNNMVRKNNSPKVPEAQGLLPPPPPPLLAPPAPVLSDYQLPTYKTAPGDSQTQATPSSKKVRGINVSWAFWLGQLMLRFLHKDFSLLSYVRAEDVLLQ